MRILLILLFMSFVGVGNATAQLKRCQSALSQIFELPHRLFGLPAEILGYLAPFHTRYVFRGIQGVPVFIAIEHLENFIRKETIFSARDLVDAEVFPEHFGRFPESIAIFLPTPKLKKYLETLVSCSECSDGERNLVAYLVSSMISSLRAQYFSPLHSIAKSWGSIKLEYGRSISLFGLDVEMRYRSISRSIDENEWVARRLKDWSELGFVLSLPRRISGPLHGASEPIPPYDIEIQVLVSPEVIFKSARDNLIKSVQIGGTWYSASNPVVFEQWHRRFITFNKSIDIILKGVDLDLSPRQVVDKLSNVE